MKTVVVPSLAEKVGAIWKELQAKYTKDGVFYVASPLSSTPLPIYQWIIDHAAEFQNWDKVRFILMDEMLQGEKSPFKYVPITDPASYEGFAQKNFLESLSKKAPISTEVVKPNASRIEEFHTEIDLLILAIGVKGNYANVMPGVPEEIGWHIAHLTPEFRQAHTKESGAYEGADFREYGMSLGPQQVLAAKNIVVIISGEKKRELTKRLLSSDSFNPEFPLSIIYHPKVKARVEIYITNDVGLTL